MTREEMITAVAREVLADRRKQAEHDPRHTPYYLMNISHPVLRQYYLDWLAKTGESAPPGDEARTRFEVAMLHPAVLRRMAEEYRKQGRIAE